MEEIIAEHSGQPLEKVSADMERDYFMTAEEAKEYGLIDNVLARRFESAAGPVVELSGSRTPPPGWVEPAPASGHVALQEFQIAEVDIENAARPPFLVDE